MSTSPRVNEPHYSDAKFIAQSLVPVIVVIRIFLRSRSKLLRLSSACRDFKESLTIARDGILQHRFNDRTNKLRSAMKQWSEDFEAMAEQRMRNKVNLERMRKDGPLKRSDFTLTGWEVHLVELESSKNRELEEYNIAMRERLEELECEKTVVNGIMWKRLN